MNHLPSKCDIEINTAPLGVAVKIYLRETSFAGSKRLLVFRGSSTFGIGDCDIEMELFDPDRAWKRLERITETRKFKTRKGIIDHMLASAKQMHESKIGEW